MKIHMSRRLFLPAAVLGGVAVFAAVFFVALAVHSVVADPGGPVPNPGHAWTEIQGHGDDADACYVSTENDQAFEVRVNGSRALRLEPTTDIPNLIGGYSGNNVTAGAVGATIGGGGQGGNANRVTDEFGTVGGGIGNLAGNDEGGTIDDVPHATVAGGGYNTASGHSATVAGGYNNTASANQATVGGGEGNTATGGSATVAGGDFNAASGSGATVGGGGWNTADNEYATVAGGNNNTASGDSATIGGGDFNAASGGAATVGGGAENTASDDYATVGGGYSNQTTEDAPYATVGGGYDNQTDGWYATVGGGRLNIASASDATVGGGVGNTASGGSATVAGGDSNIATGGSATVGGGESNTADGVGTTVGGGIENDSGGGGAYTTVGGGLQNTVVNDRTTVGGGANNSASGYAATVPGGESNNADGDYSFAAGRQASAAQNGCFVWGDGSATAVSCDSPDEFVVQAGGGLEFHGASDLSDWVKISQNPTGLITTSTGGHLTRGGVWTNASDGDMKENFSAVDGQAVLASLAEMPISTWNHKTEDASVRHMGPTAQDFYAAFNLGPSDTSIGTLDADGVALAAIQGLYEVVQEQDARIQALEARVAALEGEAPADGGSAGPLLSVMPFGPLLLGGLVVGGLVLVQRRRAGGRS